MQQMNVCVSVCIYVHVCVWGGVHMCMYVCVLKVLLFPD